jgi:hypothetical protein
VHTGAAGHAQQAGQGRHKQTQSAASWEARAVMCCVFRHSAGRAPPGTTRNAIGSIACQ